MVARGRRGITGTRATSDVWLGDDGHGYAFRVRATDTKGQRGYLERGVRVRLDAVDRRGRLRPRGCGRPRVPHGSGRVRRQARHAVRGHDRGLYARAGLGRRPHLVRGHPAHRASGRPSRSWSAASGWPSARPRPRTSPRIAPRTAPGWMRACGTWTSAPVAPRAPAHAGLRAFSPDGDGSGDALRIRWTATVAMTTLALKVYRRDGTLVGTRAVADLAAGSRTWDWDGKIDGRAVPDGSYAIQLVGHRRGQDVPCPIRPSGDACPAGRLRDHRRHHRSGGHVRHGVVLRHLAQRRRDPGLHRLRAGRHRGDPLGRAHLQHRGRGRPISSRFRRQGHVHLDRHQRRRRPGARRELHRHPHRGG